MPRTFAPAPSRLPRPRASQAGVPLPVSRPSRAEQPSGAGVFVDAATGRVAAVHAGGRVAFLESDERWTLEVEVGPSSGEVVFGAIPSGYRVVEARVRVTSDFDGGGVSMGDGDDGADWLPEQGAPKAGELYLCPMDARYPSGGVAVIVVASGATTGAAVASATIARIP